MAERQGSPYLPEAGALDHFNIYDSASLESSRDAFRIELDKKIIYDHPSVFRRLHLDDVPDVFVEACMTKFFTHNGKDIERLKDIEELASPNNDINVRKLGREMYTPLKRIFDYVQTFEGAVRPQGARQFISGRRKANKTLDNLYFPTEDPDFTLVSPPTIAGTVAANDLWRHRDAFVQIKPTTEQGPSSLDLELKDVVVQAAHYARLHMSARPFLLFSIGVLICGSDFCAGIFDRDGITFSPVYNTWDSRTDGPSVFIRLIRSLACNLSSVAMGADPTTIELDEPTSLSVISPILMSLEQRVNDCHAKIASIRCEPSGIIRATAEAALKQAKLELQRLGHPNYVVSLGGNDSRQWCTIGAPYWNPLSFTGRGTSVWLVKEYVDGVPVGDELMMKNAWRISGRSAESNVYRKVETLLVDYPPGLAKLSTGGDVKHPCGVHDVEVDISVYGLRGYDPATVPNSADRFLHRTLLKTVGRPLWDCSSELELLQGIRAALIVHRSLSEQGILHRDVNAGNIFVAKTIPASPGEEGFLSDFELAHISRPTVQPVKETVVGVSPVPETGTRPTKTTRPAMRTAAILSEETVEHEDGVAGTAQFMSVECLEAAIYKRSIQMQPHHDIESFLWVLGYALMRRIDASIIEDLSMTTEQKVEWHHIIVSPVFGHHGLVATRNSRVNMSPLNFFHQSTSFSMLKFISEPVQTLFFDLTGPLLSQMIPYLRGPLAPAVYLTYDKVLGLGTIAQLQGDSLGQKIDEPDGANGVSQ